MEDGRETLQATGRLEARAEKTEEEREPQDPYLWPRKGTKLEPVAGAKFEMPVKARRPTSIGRPRSVYRDVTGRGKAEPLSTEQCSVSTGRGAASAIMTLAHPTHRRVPSPK